jgi:A118 family predicted phage portal protein
MWRVFRNIKQIIQKLFGKKVDITDQQVAQADKDVEQYLDVSKENITSIVANAIANLVFGDAQLLVSDDSEMGAMLNEILQKEFVKAKRNYACALGTGEILSVPYCVDNGLGRKVYVDTVTKDRFWVTERQGTDATEVEALADVKIHDNKLYERHTYYRVENGSYEVLNKALQGDSEVMLGMIDEWQGIDDKFNLNGVDKLPVAIGRCPAGGHRPDDQEGRPLTFGCDSILKKIQDTINDFETEFKRKKVKVFADSMMFKSVTDNNGNIIVQDDDDVFFKMNASEDFGLEIFSPEFRDTSYYNKLQYHFELLEKQIGVNKGVLTELSTGTATATEIRRSTYQTFCLVDDIRKSYEKYINDLAYGIQVLLVAYNLAPYSDYEVKISWSNALLEDRAETYNQMVQGVSQGAERVAELRLLNHPDESLEEAQAIVDEIAETNPPLGSLFDEGTE